MGYSLAEAARAIGVSKPTLFRAIKSGRLSATRRDDGSYDVDPAELHRAFPPAVSDKRDATQDLKRNETTVLRAETDVLRERLAEQAETIADLRRRLDAEAQERRQVQARLTGLLTDERAQPAARRGWWPWRRGK